MGSGRDAIARTLSELRLEREQLDAVLSHAPAAVDAPLVAAVRRRDELLARQHVWLEKLATADHQTERSTQPRTTRARRELAAVERELARAAQRVTALQGRSVQRREFLDQHRLELERREVIRRLEEARELQVRLGATERPPSTLLERIGRRPTDERRRQFWSRAVEETAVLSERYNGDAASMLAAGTCEPWLREYRGLIAALVPEPEVAAIEILDH
jgi:hypothetical protein